MHRVSPHLVEAHAYDARVVLLLIHAAVRLVMCAHVRAYHMQQLVPARTCLGGRASPQARSVMTGLNAESPRNQSVLE